MNLSKLLDHCNKHANRNVAEVLSQQLGVVDFIPVKELIAVSSLVEGYPHTFGLDNNPGRPASKGFFDDDLLRHECIIVLVDVRHNRLFVTVGPECISLCLTRSLGRYCEIGTQQLERVVSAATALALERDTM